MSNISQPTVAPELMKAAVRRHAGHLNCFATLPTNAAGYWFGDDPFRSSLPLLMVQISLIVSISSVMHHWAFRHIGLPSHFSHILTGIILGPSFLGRFDSFKEEIFPAVSFIQLDIVSLIGALLYIFMISVKTDIRMVKRSGKKAVAMAFSGTLTSSLVVLVAWGILFSSAPEDLKRSSFFIKIASTWSFSAYVNLSYTLEELNLLNSKLGRFSMSISLIAECIDMIFVRSIIGSVVLGQQAQSQSTLKAWSTILMFVGLLVYIVFVARPITTEIIRKTPEGELLDEPYLIAIMMLAFSCALFSEVIGHHSIVGIIIFGLVLPSGPPLGTTLAHRLEGLIFGLVLPVYMSRLGLRVDLWNMVVDLKKWGFVQLGLLLSVAGKFVGAAVPAALLCKMPLSDALSLGLMLNIKGFFEVEALYTWQDYKFADDQTSAVVLFNILALMATVPTVLKRLYKPSEAYLAYKGSTFHHVNRAGELRLLACIHTQENVSPFINLAGAFYQTKDNPISIYLLHLIPSIGHAAAVLIPYTHNTTSNTHETDHIVNAFVFSEQHNEGCKLVQPYVSISPYATMHEDICNLAAEKKVSMVVVPFHKHLAIDGTMESVNPAHRNINVNVLNYAACSVGILVDHRLSSSGAKYASGNLTQQKVGVYFLGGPDDHEALACGMRMLHNPVGHLTVVRFRLPEEDKTETEAAAEEEDDAIINEYMMSNNTRRRERVVYREEEVRDFEEMVAVIRNTCTKFSLLIVGRRQGNELAVMTAGLSSWSEYPELGIVGDILASTDFGTKISTLVVQQQGGGGQESVAAGSLKRHERFNTQVHPDHNQHRHLSADNVKV